MLGVAVTAQGITGLISPLEAGLDLAATAAAADRQRDSRGTRLNH